MGNGKIDQSRVGGSIFSDATGCSDSVVDNSLKFKSVCGVGTPSFYRVGGEVNETFFDDLSLGGERD